MSAGPLSAGRSYHEDFDPRSLRVGPTDEVAAAALDMDVHTDDIGDLLIALIGWDDAVHELSASEHPRAGEVLLSTISWLLLG